MIGALLVTTAAVGTFAVATREEVPVGRMVVAARPLAIGDVVEAADVTTVTVDLPDAVAGALVRRADEVVGAVVLTPLEPGTPLPSRAVEPKGALVGVRYRELSISVPIGRALDGRIRSGDRLDVLASNDRETTVLVQQATVVAVDDGESGGLVDGGDVVVTLALTDGNDVLAVAHGAARGELTLVRASRAEDRLPDRFAPSAPSAVGPTSALSSSAGTEVAR